MSSRALALSLAAVALGLLAGLALLVTGDPPGEPGDAAVVTHARPEPAGPPPELPVPAPAHEGPEASVDLLAAPPEPEAPEPLVAADQRLARLTVRVEDDESRPRAGALGWLQPEDTPGLALEWGLVLQDGRQPRAATGPRPAESDDQGLLAWQGVQPGPYLLVLRHGTLELERRVELAAGEAARLTVVLAPARLTVQVDPPDAGAAVAVRAHPQHLRPALREGRPFRRQDSDDQGLARFDDLSPGSYRISADGHVYADVTLVAGEEARLALASVLTQGVTGLVLGAEGEVLVTARRAVARKAWFVNPVLGQAPVDAQGRFTLWLEHPGSYTVVAERSGGGASLEAHVEVRPGQLSETTLELARGAVGGRLTWDHDGSPAADRSISLFPDGRDRRIQVRTDADGRWVVPSLGPGSHVVRVSGWLHPADRALDHVRQTELATVALAAGEQRLDLDGELCRGAGLTVTLALESALPAEARLRVALNPADERQGPARFVTLDDPAVFKELAAGAYELTLTDRETRTLLRRLPLVLGEHERRELTLTFDGSDLALIVSALVNRPGSAWSGDGSSGSGAPSAEGEGPTELVLGEVEATVIGVGAPPEDG